MGWGGGNGRNKHPLRGSMKKVWLEGGSATGGADWSQVGEGLEGHIQESSCLVLVAFRCVVFLTRINMIGIGFSEQNSGTSRKGVKLHLEMSGEPEKFTL